MPSKEQGMPDVWSAGAKQLVTTRARQPAVATRTGWVGVLFTPYTRRNAGGWEYEHKGGDLTRHGFKFKMKAN